MGKKKDDWDARMDLKNGILCFGSWTLSAGLGRDTSLKDGTDNGIAIFLHGGAGDGGTLVQLLLPGPDHFIKSEESRDRVIHHVLHDMRPVAQRFIDELKATVQRCAEDEMHYLLKEEER